MQPGAIITLSREVEAVEIPYGTQTRLPAGTQVTIEQSLGGTYTVLTDRGAMVRIAGKDADALGLQAAGAGAGAAGREPESAQEVEELVWEQLKTCYDPEIPVNIVDLGLVYQCTVTPQAEGGYRVDVKMTLTAPGCGMGDVLKADAELKIGSLPGVRHCEVELVFDPPWDPSRMSDAARLQLNMF